MPSGGGDYNTYRPAGVYIRCLLIPNPIVRRVTAHMCCFLVVCVPGRPKCCTLDGFSEQVQA